MKQLLLVITFISFGFAYAQDIILDGTPGKQNVVTCSGNLYDTGGPGSVDDITTYYGDGENDTITICPDVAGKLLRLIVTDYFVQQGDQLLVFDGNSTSANKLGNYSATGLGYDLQSGDTIQATTSNVTGCLTFVFISDNDLKVDRGFNFEVKCFFPCQEVIATGTFDGLTPQQRNGPIKICIDDIVDLAGFGIYPDINTPLELYNQENSTSQFSWIVTPGNPLNSGGGAGGTYDPITDSSKTFFQFPDSGIYHIKLEVQDENPDAECKNTNYLDQIVWVSGPPVFEPTGLAPTLDTICLGDQNIIIGTIVPVLHIDNCVPPTGTLEFIPDGQDTGSGLTYESEAEFKCYPIDVTRPGTGIINNASDVVSICVDMEHSAIGDLDISLTCPSGQTVRFLVSPGPNHGVNANLGEPIVIPGSTTQGVTDTYCFDMLAASNMATAAASLSTVQKLPPGNYLPIDDFSNFIGCEINGNWVLTVKDGSINDNGYAGNWVMTLDPAILPTFDDKFINNYVDSMWTEDPTHPMSVTQAPGSIISSLAKSDTLVVLPKTIGTYCYKMEVEDDFGCFYDTTVCFVVLDKDTADFMFPKSVFCLTETGVNSPEYINNGKAGDWTVSPATGLTVDPLTGEFTAAGSTPGTYTLTNTVLNAQQKCPDVHNFDITIVDTVKPIITANPTYCTIDTAVLVNAGLFTSFTWSNASVNDTAYVFDGDNPITVTAVDANGCTTVSDPITITKLSQTQTSSTIMICEGGSATIHGQVETQEGVYSQQFSTGQTSCDSISIVTLAFYPQVTLGPDQTICDGDIATVTASGVDLPANYTWSNNFLGASQTVQPVSTTAFSVTATDVHGCQSTATMNVTVSPVRDASISYIGASFCPGSPNILPLSVATLGGVFTSSIQGLVDPVTGEVFLSSAPPGQFTVTYTLPSPTQCDIVTPITFTITNAFDGAFNYGGTDFCTNGPAVAPIFTGTGAGAFTVSPVFGLSINPSTGVIQPGSSAPGTYTITNSPAAGCPGVAGTATINVSVPPTVSAGLAQTICEGSSATLNATSPDNVTYTWNNGGGAGASVSVSPAASTTYTVTATDAVGCQATALTNVNVNFLPKLAITSADVIICAGTESAVLVGNVTNNPASDPMQFTWTPGGESSQSITVSPASTTTYTVNATNMTTNCASSPSTSASITVTVLPIPVITLAASPSTEVCLGDQVVLTGSGANVVSFQWNQGITNDVPFTATTIGTTTYTATGSGSNGCASLPVTIDVLVNPLPVIGIDGNTAQICNDGHIEVLDATSNISNTGFLWSNSETSSSISVVPTVADPTFSVTGTDANGCSNTASFTFNIVDNTVNADFTADPLIGNPGMVVDFTNQTTGADAYVWDFGNGSTVNATTLAGQTATYQDTAVYTVMLAASSAINGCKDTAYVQITVVPFDGAVLHIPNIFTPNGDGANDTFSIIVSNKQGKEMHVEVYNRWGNLLKVIDGFTDSWDGTDQGKDASEGVYFFKYRVVGNDLKVTEGHGNVTLIRAKKN